MIYLKKNGIIINHSDGSNSKNIKDGSKIKKELKMEKNTKKFRNSNSIRMLVRRTFYDIGNIIGNKGVLGELLGDKTYLPKTINVKYSNKSKLEKDLTKIWKENKFGKKNPVILKPSIGQEQRGIGVMTDIHKSVEHILQVLKKYPNYKDWEIQQYIYKPLLVKGKHLFPCIKGEIKLKDGDGETEYRIR